MHESWPTVTPLVVDGLDLEKPNHSASEFIDALDRNDGPDEHALEADADLLARIRRLVKDDFPGVVAVRVPGIAKLNCLRLTRRKRGIVGQERISTGRSCA